MSLKDSYPLVKACVMECRPYVAGRPREEVQRVLGIQDVIKLASNENALGPSPRALEAVQREAHHMNLYPDDACSDLKLAVAGHWELGADQVLVGNGSMQILELLCKTFLNPDEEVVTADPSFRVFGGLVRSAGGVHVPVPLRSHVHDLEGMLAALTPRTKMVIVCNPNNPTGTVVAPDALRDFTRRLPPGVVFVLDEAYVDFSEAGAVPDFREILQIAPNAVVLRTFSKIYGMAGMRVGYALAAPRLIDYLERARMPFVANRLALAGALAALDDDAFVRASRSNNFAGLDAMRKGLSALRLGWLPTQTNFLAVQVGGNDQAYFEAMLREGVIVFPGSATDMPGWVRVTVGLPDQVERFLQATRRVLGR